MYKLQNYIVGQWITGDGDGQLLFNAVTGEPIAAATTKGLDFKAITDYGRKIGNPALRKMTFHERGNMLKALALHLRNHLDKFYAVSYQTGATKADSWVDIEGGIGNLFANASLRRKLSNETFVVDGESHNFGKNNTGTQRRRCHTH
jgi:oxepin-CoA hydrolase / 3-oxo-5,6-dehydrosuberyl-CoA semialdehyde dehydrogenase